MLFLCGSLFGMTLACIYCCCVFKYKTSIDGSRYLPSLWAASSALDFLCSKVVHPMGALDYSYPGSTPVCPRYFQIALTSFQGLTRVSPNCPACGVGHLGAGPRCMTSPREGEWSFDYLLSRAHLSEHRGVDTGKLIERTQMNQAWSLIRLLRAACH